MTNKEKTARMDREQPQGFDGVAVRRASPFLGYALSLAQIGDQDDAAKVLKGFGGAGVLEVVEDDAGGTYRAAYTRSSLRKRCSSCTASRRRKQERNRHAKGRHGHHPRSAEGGRGIGTGSYEMQKRIIEGVEVQRSSGNVFADLGLPDAESSRSRPAWWSRSGGPCAPLG
ncbi:hypothetical protein OMD46_13035 [Pseudomonas sp. MDMC_285]|nr:hypothetical protein [Pseudomonas sp. MDMC_285]